MDTGAEYVLTRADDGRLTVIQRTRDGASISQDHNNADYQDFLKWAAQQSPPVNSATYVFPSDHNLFTDKSAFWEYCKASGFRIAVSQETVSSIWTLWTASGNADKYGMGRMTRLCEATAATDSDSGEDGLTRKNARVWIGDALFDSLQQDLNAKDDNDTKRLSTMRFDRCFVYLDISDFTEGFLPGAQLLVLQSLIKMLGNRTNWSIQESEEAALCIGDGYIFAFRSAFGGVWFAAQLAGLIDLRVAKRSAFPEFHFRVGVHWGPVYTFWDKARAGWNYVGEGINGGRRVLEAVGKSTDDTIYISDQVRHEITRTSDNSDRFNAIEQNLRNMGRKKDKHGRPWRVYELNYVPCRRIHPDDADASW